MPLGWLGERYELLEKIAEGGAATVYRARDARLGRLVAVKVLRPEHREDPAFVERLQREARLAASLSHPNVVAVYDWQADSRACYFVMEYVEGESLKERVRRRGSLPAPEAIAIAQEVLAALQAAHRAGIVHRDVKPQNVLITPDGVAKLADFGIARAAEASFLTPTGLAMGTPHYLSPEQAQGQPAGPASDVYSAGVVLYEMLTGRLPFEGESAVAIALKHVEERPEPPRRLVPGLSPELERIVLKALAKRPEERWPSAAAMAGALERCAAQAAQPTSPSPVSPGRSLRLIRARLRAGLLRRRLWPAFGRASALPWLGAVFVVSFTLAASLWLGYRLSLGSTPTSAAAGGKGTPSPSPTLSSTPEPSLAEAVRRIVAPDTPTPTPTPSASPTPRPTDTPTPTPSPTPTRTPTPMPTATPTRTPTATPTPVPVVVELVIPPLSAAEHRIAAPLRSGQVVAGTIAVQGGRRDVRVTVFGGDDGFVFGPQTVSGELRFSWPVTRKGPWRVVFDNRFSIFTSKQVSLTYQVVSQ